MATISDAGARSPVKGVASRPVVNPSSAANRTPARPAVTAASVKANRRAGAIPAAKTAPKIYAGLASSAAHIGPAAPQGLSPHASTQAHDNRNTPGLASSAAHIGPAAKAPIKPPTHGGKPAAKAKPKPGGVGAGGGTTTTKVPPAPAHGAKPAPAPIATSSPAPVNASPSTGGGLADMLGGTLPLLLIAGAALALFYLYSHRQK